MKAKVKETGEIIDVHSLYPVTYSRLDCNGKIREEYDEDELEFEPGPTMVSIEAVAKWLNDNLDKYVHIYDQYITLTENCNSVKDVLIEDLKDEFE